MERCFFILFLLWRWDVKAQHFYEQKNNFLRVFILNFILNGRWWIFYYKNSVTVRRCLMLMLSSHFWNIACWYWILMDIVDGCDLIRCNSRLLSLALEFHDAVDKLDGLHSYIYWQDYTFSNRIFVFNYFFKGRDDLKSLFTTFSMM